MTGDAQIKILTPDDWPLYRALRLECLEREPWAFSMTRASQLSLAETYWRQACFKPDDTQSYILYKNRQPVGFTGVTMGYDDPSGQTAVLYRSYIQTPHRGQGYSDYFYRLRLQWALDHNLKYAEAGFRRANTVSQHAAQKWGFGYSHSKTGKVFNNEPDDLLYYRVTLADIAARLAELDRVHPIPFMSMS